MYLLDTNICIYIIKQKPPSVLAKFQSLQIGSVAMSMVTFGELQYSALRSNNAQKALDILQELKAYIPVLAMSDTVADEYADIRANLAKNGQMIGNNDLWIAAHARDMGHTLVSNNIKKFKRVENLALENWV